MRFFLALLALGCITGALALSIESEPVKVTHRNSGPRYELDADELDPSKLTPVSHQHQQHGAPNSESSNSDSRHAQEDGDQEQAAPVGRISIRRIFLVPMMQPARPDWLESGAPGEPGREPKGANQDQAAHSEPTGMFVRPFWPFLAPARPPHSHHLLGTDEASRSPNRDQDQDQDRAASSGAEREGDLGPQQPAHPMIDPFQMMMDIMHQVINSQLAPPSIATDLNKDASTRAGANESSASPEERPAKPSDSSDERPQMPAGTEPVQGAGSELKPLKPSSQNETREDVVEIEGKKYLRKTVINRHVGENIIFMTKRLIFVPLNETETAEPGLASERPAIPTTQTEAATTTVSSTLAPTTTTYRSETSTTTSAPSSEAPIERKPSNELSTPADPTTEAPTTTLAPSTPEPSTTAATGATAAGEETTTTKAKSSWVDRVMDTVDKVAERLVESPKSDATTTTTTTTTEKPSDSSS